MADDSRIAGHAGHLAIALRQGNDKKHNAPVTFVANEEANCKGYWIKLAAHPDGGFTIQNGRTQMEKVYR